MSKYYKLTYFTSGEEYDYRERLLDEDTFRRCRQAIIEGAEFLVFDDKVIKTKMVKEISDATGEVNQYMAQGTPLKSLGLKEIPKLESRNIEDGKYLKLKKSFTNKTKTQ